MNAKKRNGFKRTLVAVSVELALCSLAVAQEAPVPAKEKKDVTTLNAVVVTGTRDALEKSLELKKNAIGVQDSISAEDMGRFPDDNVADALGHITGVTVTRGGGGGIGSGRGMGGGGGEGMGVSIRGLGPEFAMTTFNGRLLATDADSRNFAFDTLPSEVISGADVYKSAQASHMEGAIGGIVNLKTSRPLDKPGMHTSVRVEGDYNDLSSNRGSKVAAGFSGTFMDNTIGLSVGLLKSKATRRTDGIDDYAYTPKGNYSEIDLVVNGKTVPSQSIVGLENFSIGTMSQTKERTAFSSTLEWKPFSNVRMALDVLSTRLNAPQVGNSMSYYFGDYPGPGFLENVTANNGVMTGFSTRRDGEWGDAVYPEILNRKINRVVDTTLVGWNGEWKVNDALKLTGDIYQSKANRDEGGRNVMITAGMEQDALVTYRGIRDSLPFISAVLADGRDMATAAADGSLQTGDTYGVKHIRFSGNDMSDKVTGASIAGSLKLDWGNVDTLKFGASNTQRQKIRLNYNNNNGVLGQTKFPYATGTGTYTSVNQYQGRLTFDDPVMAGVLQPVAPNDFLRGAGGAYPTAFVDFNLDAFLAGLKKLDGTMNTKTGKPYDLAKTITAFNIPRNNYDVQEKTNALFGEVDMSGDNWFGNIGLRMVKNDTVASNNKPALASFHGTGLTAEAVFDPSKPFTLESSDTRYLPSANFGYWARPDFLVRVAGAQTMARPTQDQLNPICDVNASNKTILCYGHPGLKPTDADQADVSLEWYYAPKSMLTGAMFVKKIKNFISYRRQAGEDVAVLNTDTGKLVNFAVERPANGDNADVMGFEIGLQHMFDNGFGVSAKITKTNSTSYIDGVNVGELDGVAPNASSLTFMYEKDKINAQVSIDYTGAYQNSQRYAAGGLKQDYRPMTWVGATFSYQLNKQVRLFVEGKNLTDAVERATLAGAPDAAFAYSVWGRTYVMGAAAKF